MAEVIIEEFFDSVEAIILILRSSQHLLSVFLRWRWVFSSQLMFCHQTRYGIRWLGMCVSCYCIRTLYPSFTTDGSSHTITDFAAKSFATAICKVMLEWISVRHKCLFISFKADTILLDYFYRLQEHSILCRVFSAKLRGRQLVQCWHSECDCSPPSRWAMDLQCQRLIEGLDQVISLTLLRHCSTWLKRQWRRCCPPKNTEFFWHGQYSHLDCVADEVVRQVCRNEGDAVKDLLAVLQTT